MFGSLLRGPRSKLAASWGGFRAQSAFFAWTGLLFDEGFAAEEPCLFPRADVDGSQCDPSTTRRDKPSNAMYLTIST